MNGLQYCIFIQFCGIEEPIFITNSSVDFIFSSATPKNPTGETITSSLGFQLTGMQHF